MSTRITMLLTNGFDPDVRVYKEAVYLISRGFAVTILCWDRDPSMGYPEQETLNGIKVLRFRIPSVAGSGKKQLPAFHAYIRACRAYLKTHPCDYLHCNDIDGAITGYFARHGKTPMVFDMHEFYECGSAAKRRVWRFLTLFLLKRSVTALYENTVYLEAPYAAVRSKLYPLKNYPDSKLVRPLPKTESAVFRIGYHGAVRGQIPEFTALFEAVKDMPDVQVDINGGGPDLAQLRELEGQYPNVHIHGVFDGTAALTGLYETTDVLFAGYDPQVPNHQGDAEAVKFYEAIFTGTPMLMTRGIGMGDKVERFGFGLTCDTRNPTEIRDALLQLKTDRKLWRACAQNELSHAHEYAWDTAVTVLDKIYQKA